MIFLITSALVVLREIKGSHDLTPSHVFFGFVSLTKHFSHKETQEKSAVYSVTKPLPVSPTQRGLILKRSEARRGQAEAKVQAWLLVPVSLLI